MSDDDFDGVDQEVLQGDRALIVKLLKNNSIIFEKSKIPSVVKGKNSAWLKMLDDYNKTLGKDFNLVQLKKLVNNMKNLVKKKTDRNATGNKPIKLRDWEKELLEILSAEVNPVFTRIPNALSAGVSLPNSSTVEEPLMTGNNDGQQPPKIRKTKAIVNKYECEETKTLSTPELQRVVLLQQYQLQKIQIEKEQLKLKKLKEAVGNDEEMDNETMNNENLLELSRNTDGDFGEKYILRNL